MEGDFNGDGKTDAAVFVIERSTGKIGIAIVHRTARKVTILGGGVSLGNGGDDFEWMDSWKVSKTRATPSADAASIPRLRGDALLVRRAKLRVR